MLGYVLNACRRQGSFHQLTARSAGIDGIVLNACRRQRSFHPSSRVPAWTDYDVLNACRRQRSFHIAIDGQPASTLSGAQRLSASRIVSPMPHIAVSTAVSSAQRLSASKIGSRRLMASASTSNRVLNACRRQRSVHAGRAGRRATSSVCSTPVGVKDRFTARVRSHCLTHCYHTSFQAWTCSWKNAALCDFVAVRTSHKAASFPAHSTASSIV